MKFAITLLLLLATTAFGQYKVNVITTNTSAGVTNKVLDIVGVRYPLNPINTNTPLEMTNVVMAIVGTNASGTASNVFNTTVTSPLTISTNLGTYLYTIGLPGDWSQIRLYGDGGGNFHVQWDEEYSGNWTNQFTAGAESVIAHVPFRASAGITGDGAGLTNAAYVAAGTNVTIVTNSHRLFTISATPIGVTETNTITIPNVQAQLALRTFTNIWIADPGVGYTGETNLVTNTLPYDGVYHIEMFSMTLRGTNGGGIDSTSHGNIFWQDQYNAWHTTAAGDRIIPFMPDYADVDSQYFYTPQVITMPPIYGYAGRQIIFSNFVWNSFDPGAGDEPSTNFVTCSIIGPTNVSVYITH